MSLTPTQPMAPEAKKALSRTIRALRERLLGDLHTATESTYRLGVKLEAAKLDEAAQTKRARLEAWIDEQVRTLPKAARKDAGQRLRGEVEKDAAFTLLLRLTYLRLLEASGLRRDKLVTGGWESQAYKDFRQLAPELVRGDATEGYATLLRYVFADLAVELPGLFGDVRLTGLMPIPAATLRHVVEQLNHPELDSCWGDDTTLGWVYQYWNDPEREALDAKLNESKKLENHEIAPKTQMFTERYMVEWLLHNSIGTQWLAICKKHGWTADFEAPGPPEPKSGAPGLSVREQLAARRAQWRQKREAGEVPLDALMPIEPGLEERWKYWVPQPIVDDAVDKAPDSLRDYKLLDPACGSGHFLVIALGLLFELYREEARHRGKSEMPQWQPKAIVERILERNLHGIDIDPRAVQIAAAALMLKAKQLCPETKPASLQLVAPALSLANLPPEDPALVELFERLERDAGVSPQLCREVLRELAAVDHLGSLLRVDAALLGDDFEEPAQSALFGDRRRERSITPVGATTRGALTLLLLQRFLEKYRGSGDLGLRLRGQQLAAGLRFMRIAREGRYDLVVGNPPYQGTSKMADAKYVQKHYPKGKADLYAAFLERGLQLAKPGGISALLTMRGWMFIKQYAAIREWLLETFDLRMLGDVDRGAFDEVPNEVLAAVMSLFRRAQPGDVPSVAMQPTPLEDKSYDRERTKRKRAAVLCQVGRFEFSGFESIEGRPAVYWWSSEFIERYARTPKIGDEVPMKVGVQTSDDVRFLRMHWEVSVHDIELKSFDADTWKLDNTWYPVVCGADGRKWFEDVRSVLRWWGDGLEVAQFSRSRYGRGAEVYFLPGVAFTTIGDEFGGRVHRARSVISSTGCSLYPDDRATLVCLLNSELGRFVLSSLNPTIHFTNGDVQRLPLFEQPRADQVFTRVDTAFTEHESHRETSVEFQHLGPSPWRYAQDWAQRAIDRPDSAPLPPYEPEYDPEPATDHLSFALGVALGRFGAGGEGILDPSTADLSAALPHGTLYLSSLHEQDSLAHPAAQPLRDAWAVHGEAIQAGEKRTRSLREYLQDKFFPDVHKGMYENRPIHFPLSSKGRSFVAWVNIHRWHDGTLRALLAEHLYPDKQRLDGELEDLREARASADNAAARDAERRFTQLKKWQEELDEFIAQVEQCAEKGPPPTDAKCPARETDRRFAMDLDDGVMINSAALWPLLEPQWKDPKKWWKQLAEAKGKKDYDWAHLAARYFPSRVYEKCQADPSLAVAHGCFWKLHPANAYKWELRLQDEIGPDFTLDEPARTANDAFTPAWVQESSDHYRAQFEAEHADKVEELVAAEQKRRERKRKKQGEAAQVAQGELGLGDDPEGEREEAAEGARAGAQ